MVWSREQVTLSPAGDPSHQLSDTFTFRAPVLLHFFLRNIRQSWYSSTKCSYLLTFFREEVPSKIPRPVLYLRLLAVYIV